MLTTILLVFAFVLFAVAAYLSEKPAEKLTRLGLALWVLSILLGGVSLPHR